MLEGCRSPGASNAATGDFFTVGEGSHKVSSTVISASSRRLPQVDMDDAHQVSKCLLKCPQEVEFFFSEVTMYMSLWILRELHAHLITQPMQVFAYLLRRSNPEGEITVQKCEEFLSQASSISDEDYEDFLVTISESMAKKITDQETYLKNNWTVVLQPFVFVSKESYAPDENHSASHSLDGNEETGTLWISDFLQTSTRGGRELRRNLALSFPAPASHRREEELLREDISSLQMIEPFSFIVALARTHYSAINKSDSFDIVPPNDRALRYFLFYINHRDEYV
ncbi:unnamed protein product [Miscanthus lutarioriparius]|uniref:Uncharacterized protein n=1 Tax=Miscanthus lutarioriparius TaxID=422564 RepID=A0A811SL25_9POAL|nr:unnamed protein product [Miscanthus lutarioriparius]